MIFLEMSHLRAAGDESIRLPLRFHPAECSEGFHMDAPVTLCDAKIAVFSLRFRLEAT